MSKRTALRNAPALRRRPALMATAAVVALAGLPMGPAWADPNTVSQEGSGAAASSGIARPSRGEGVVRSPQASNGTARLPRGENVVRVPQNAPGALPEIGHHVLPRDPNVVAGGATFAEDGSRLDVNQSTDRVVIDWRSFDIGRDAEVNFYQPGTSSIAVNRISQGGVPSQIQGVLRANGTVVILNPNGVIFSATSRVDVGGLVASTGRMDVSQFMAGSNRLDFTDATSGEIVMGGSINIADAGLAAFVAPHVRNDGVINARFGRVALAAGETFTLDLAGDRLIELGLGAHSPLVENFGSILVDGGRVQLSAVAAGAVIDQVINAGGLISVASARAEGGAIVLEGANGGVTVSGELNASGATGGGDIALGGGAVETTTGAVLRADATGTGDGGSIVSMADGSGTYAGTLSARGGVQGGDGGFIETSGKIVSLDAGLRVDTTAADGANGSWSIDPEDLVIGAGEAAAVVASLATTNVVLQAQNSISIDSLIDSSAQGNANTLSLNDEGGVAGLTVDLNAAIRLGANQRLMGQATQINVRNGGVIQNAVDVALANAGILVSAGDYAAGAIINKDGLTLTGEAGARIVLPVLAAGQQLNGLTINADHVTVQGLEIAGPVDQSWETYAWNGAATGGITRGIFAMNGADDFTIANNNIHDVRNGILVDGRNAGGSVTGNIIDNTKSGVSVQYTDAGLLNAEGFAVNIAGNSEGQYGNEWGFNFHLNGHQTPGGLVGNAVKIAPTASMAVQQALLAVSAANGGMSAQDQGYSFSNRTQAWVGAAGNNANQGSQLGRLASIQAGIDAVVTGGRVNVGNGAYVIAPGGYINVNKSLTLVGESQAGVIIDARGASSYGLRVTADNDVSLSNFTLYGVTAAGGYGLKAEEVAGLTLANITSQGAFKAEFDLNGVINATLTNLTADGASVSSGALTGGAGVAITDSQHVTLTGVTTRNNAWGGLALYQANKPTGYLTRMDDINVGLSNTFNEQNGIYAEDESPLHDFGTLNIAGYDFVAGNQSNPADTYLWFQKTLAGAMGILDATGTAGVGYIEGWTGSATNNVFNVGVTAGGTTMSINAAIRPADQGAIINVGAGTYNETVQIAEGLTLSGAGIGQTNLTGGVLMSGAFSDLTLRGFTVTGNAGGNFVVQGGQVTNLTVDGVRIDAQSVAGRHGFGSGQYGGAISITNSQFANIDGWVVFDTRSGAGSGAGTQIASGVFSNNTIDNSHGNVNFRQQTGAFAYPDIVIANNTVTNVGSSNNSFGAVFKVFNANTVDFTGNSVSGVGTSGFNPAGEAPYGAVLMTRSVNQLNIVGNIFANNNQVLAIEPGRGLSTNTFLAGNSFINNRYGVYMPGNALTGGTVTFGAGNSFVAGADTVQHIVWRGAAGLDLTNVLFDGKLTSQMNLGELFDLEDLISHATDLAGVGFATFKAGEVFVTVGSGSVQRGVDVAGQGDTVHVDAGTYAIPGELSITKSLSLVGAGAGGTIFNSASTGYGVFVAADNVTLGGFTFNGNPGGSYGVKVQPNSSDSAARVHGFTIADVAINGTRRTGLDLNGVVGAVIDGVTVTGTIAGNGISITDSADVVVRNTATAGNAWGGLALYQSNRFFDQQIDGIVVEASNVFGEAAGLYTQDSSATLNFGALTIEGMGFTVRNDAFRPDGAQFTFYKSTLQNALDYGVGLGASASYVEGWSGSQGDSHFYVGGGDAGAGQQFLSIQTAFDKSATGSVIDIFSGDYTGVATLAGQRDLRFGVVTLGGLDLTSGASGTVISGDITATGGLDFAGAIVLGGDTRLAAAGDISLIGVDGAPGGQQSLAVEGQDAVHVGQVGASGALASLSVVGSDVTMRGATTTGDQFFAGDTIMLWGGFDAGGDFTVGGPTTLGGDTVIDSGGDIQLGAIDGQHNLSLNAAGAVDLGVIGAVEALNGLNVLGAAVTSRGATTQAFQSWNAATVGLSGAYVAGGDITVNGAANLNGSTSLTSEDYVAMGSVEGAHDLTIQAANFASLGPIGGATALVDLVVEAGQITAVGARTTGSQAFSGADVGLSGVFIAGGDFTVDGATDLNGDVAIDGDDVTLASVNGAHDLTVGADGAVSLGAVGSTTALASLDVSGALIASHGAVTTGSQTFQAASVGLSGVFIAGGDFTVDGATDLNGDVAIDGDDVTLASVNGAHDLTVGADGAVAIGTVGSTTALAALDVSGASIASHGAVTTGDQSWGAATVGLTGLYAAGGDFVVEGAAILNGATSIDADAVVMGTVNGAQHLSIAADGAVSLGVIGATAALTGLDVSGASIVARGARTIGAQSWTGQAIRLAGVFVTDNGDFSLIGLTTLDGATAIATNGGDVVAGAVNGTSAGGQSLSIDAGAGTASLGLMGAGVRLGAVLVRSAGTVLNGSTYAGSSLSFLGSGAGSTVRLTQAVTTFNSAPTGSAAGAIVIQPHLIGAVNGAQSVVFNAGSGVGADNGDITLGNVGSEALRLGAMTVSGDDFSAQTVKLAGDFTSVLSGNQVFSANTLDTLANVNARVGGNDSGPVVAGGAVTLATAGTSTGSIAAGGPVNVVAGGAINHDIASTGSVAVASTGGSVTGGIQGGGAVSVNAQGAINTNVITTGTVAVASTGGSVTGSVQGGAGVTITAQGPITANVSTPGVVTVTSPQPVNVNVNAGSVVVNAPGGKVEGTFGSITTDPNGTINVNGQTVVGAGSTDARQILVDRFLAPAGGVVGASGQIRLPVNLAVALIAPAGEGQGNRRPVVVNSIDRLGELLRLGYTAIIVQLDSGEAYEQEIDLAAGTETQPAG